ncbi:MAG TPA: protease pro-enzyme activation domain-containing protein [Candidatus Acidoferrales bacterium]|nr:protease pro-enzyme activation domain-containing protein [Candidatus Acidoferrales bacterium]
MQNRWSSGIKVSLVFFSLLICSLSLSAQTQNTRTPLIQTAVNEGNLTTLKGNVHPLANAKFDQGTAPDSLLMDRMLLVLKRSSTDEAALRKLEDDQQSKSSPNFHNWLTPEQFGTQFGITDADLQVVTGWLQSKGFQVNRVAAGRMLIEFSGTAGQVRSAFHTEIHKYVVNGEAHWANASDPQIPAALTPVIAGVDSMHNFHHKSMIHAGQSLPMPQTTGKGTPELTVTPCDINGAFKNPIFNHTCFGLGPADFAKIYNIPAAATGAGQTIAIVNDSNICTGTPLPTGCTVDDVAAFRALFGLAGNNTKVIIDGIDPGLSGDEVEAILDTEWSGAVAPAAAIDLVIAANTETSSGIDLAAEHVIDGNLAGVMSTSFGTCEAFLGTGGNAFWATIWEQAAAQGISAFVSAGDSGSANCDSFVNAASNGTFVNGIASTPFDAAIGGTDFDYNATGYPGTFWNTTATLGLSAKSYIPETPWNDSCGQSPVFTTCNPPAQPFLQNISATGGGPSDCAVVSGGVCTQAYSKPPWQVATGVPNDSVRDLPDASLFAAPGTVSNSFYAICEADFNPGVPSCTNAPGAVFIPVGGTSASTPAFAGILALVNQAMVTAGKSPRQGNPNYVMYPLFATETLANCNSSTTPAGTCVFNDVTKGTNSVACVSGSPNCGANLSLVTTGTTPAYATNAGFDMATGLGSLNVANFITGWVTEAGSFVPTTTTLCMSLTATANTSCAGPITITHGTQVFVNAKVTSGGATPTGDITLIGNGTFPPGNTPTSGVDHFDAVTGNADIYSLTGGISTGGFTFELVGGTYTVTAHYPGNNGGAGLLFGVSDSTPGIQVTVSPEASTTTMTVLQSDFTQGTITQLASGASVPYGSALTFRADVLSTAVHNGSQLETGTGNITFTDTPTPFPSGTPATFALNSDGFTDFNSPSFNLPGNNPPVGTIPAIGVGSHTVSASYPGDPSYSASSTAAPAFTMTVTKAPTSPTISGPSTVNPNANFTLTALVDTTPDPINVEGSLGAAPTGTVTFKNGATQVGNPVSVSAILDANNFSAAQATLQTSLTATGSFTAVYSGDGNYLPSTSPVFTVTLAPPDMTITKSHSGSFLQGQVGATYTITVTNSGGSATTGAVNVVDTVPAGLTLTGLAGTGWTCTVGTASCTRSDALAANSSYAVITATVTVAANAPASVSNIAVVSGGGEVNTANDTATDPTTILTPPTANLSVNTLTFAAQDVGVASASMTITVTNTGGGALHFSVAPAISGTNAADFGIANSSTCTTANPVAGGGGTCVLNITITPGAAGPRGPATLTLKDDAASGTQTATLNGVGVDFTPTGQAATVTVPAGTPATFTITVADGTGGFPNPITFSTTGTLPAATTFAFSPNPVPANGTSTTLTATTTKRSGLLPQPGTGMPFGPLPIALWSLAAAILLASLMLMRKSTRRLRLGWVGMAAAFILVLVGIAGCNNSNGGGNNGTPAGTYTINIAATSGSLVHNTTVTLTVQ